MAILTNKLDIKIDYDRLSAEYDVFCIESSEDYIKNGAALLDAPETDKDIKAVSFISGKKFYVLMNSNQQNFYKLKELVAKSELSDSLRIMECDCRTLNEGLIVQLLINALGTYNNKLLKANNLTGHFYVFNPKWSVPGKYRGEDIIKQVICMEVSVSEEGYVKLPVRTFTNTRLKNLIKFKKKRFEEFPKYVYAANNTLRRKVKDDSADTFIMRQIEGKKSDIAFLDILNLEVFEATKAGMLQKVLSLFNEKYGDIAALRLSAETEIDTVDYEIGNKNAETKLVKECLQDFSVKIVDEIGTEVSKRFCEDISCLLSEIYRDSKYSIDVKIGKNTSKTALNIVVIHNKQFYLEMEDVHDKSYSGVVQHITLEDFTESSQFAIKTVVNEMLIKKDLVLGKITLFPWAELGFDGDISFGTMIKEEDSDERYFFMKISPDGSFSFAEQELNLFEITEYYDLVSIYESDNSSETIRGIIKDDKGNINVIRDAGWFTLPEIDKIAQELKNGNNKLRGKEARDRFLSSILDLKTFERYGVLYYFSGTIGNGMKAKVENSANIRKIEAYKGSKVILENLLPLMDTMLVRNGQLTVLPYPFKYLREYILTHADN